VSPYDAKATNVHERQLKELEREKIHPQFLAYNDHDELVEDGAEQKGDPHRTPLGQLVGMKGLEVDVAEEPFMDGFVPLAGVLVEGHAVPPILQRERQVREGGERERETS